jgi:hypothetical protein
VQVFRSLYRRYRLLIDTALIVTAILFVKLAVDLLGWEFFHISPLFTSIVAGGIFIVSIVLAGTLADYKEAEKLPAEIAAAIESIHAEGCYVRGTHAEFDLGTLGQTLTNVVSALRNDLATQGARTAIGRLSELSGSFLEMERLGVPPNYIVRLKQEQAIIRKNLLRLYHIQRIDFIPSAHALLASMLILIITLLVFTQVEPVYDSFILVGFISYLFIYLLKLLRTIDMPFRVDEYTMDDVSLFLLREAVERIAADAPR